MQNDIKPIEQYFIDNQSDFYNYLIDNNAFKNLQTYRDYITRLRYVAKYYKLDKSITTEYIDFIVEDLKRTMSQRDSYNSLKGISDIKSGLKKFLQYSQSDYRHKLNDTILSEEKSIANNPSITDTEKEAIIKSRVGQGLFRRKLIEYWHCCSVTNCQTQTLLIASHIRPWRKSDNMQRLDVFNGLLLIPNLDKLFDLGYISFSAKGKIICSEFLPTSEFKLLGVTPDMRLSHMNEKHLPYLKYHREYCLI